MNGLLIVVFPHFLGSGSHVATDIPDLLHQARERHPGVAIRVAPHLGITPGLDVLIHEAVKGLA